MLNIGKTAQNAIAIMSYLAECHRDGKGQVSSQAIADVRGLSKSLVGKILTTLAQKGCVKGSTGPGGGYSLAKEPKQITLLDVVSCFELQTKRVACPFGEKYCASDQKRCALHDEIFSLSDKVQKFLTKNNFGGFAE